jgi:hypothetical protein
LQASEVQERHQLSFWDAMIIVTAAKGGADVLVTEDLNPGQVIEGVRVSIRFFDDLRSSTEDMNPRATRVHSRQDVLMQDQTLDQTPDCHAVNSEDAAGANQSPGFRSAPATAVVFRLRLD